MRDLLSRMTKMPVSLALIFVWLALWILVACKKDVLSTLSGRGAALIGRQYYRFFTGWLLHRLTGSVRYLLIGLSCTVLCAIVYSLLYRNASECIGGSSFTSALLGFGLTMQLLDPGFPKLALGTWSGNWLLVYAIASNNPVRISFLPFVDAATIVTHVIAFALGAAAALAFRLLGMR